MSLNHNNQKKQAGVALVTVLLVVAFAVIIAVEMNGRLQLQLQRQLNLKGNQQALWYGMSAEAFAKQVIADGLEENNGRINLSQPWAQTGMTFPVENGTISGEISDMQACFNLNWLRAPIVQSDPSNSNNKRNAGTLAFQRLIELLVETNFGANDSDNPQSGIQLETPAEDLAARVSDWLDADSMITFAGSADEDDYASLEHPYLSANTHMVTLSELRLVSGFHPLLIEKLKPYICVIPNVELQVLNVNTLKSEHAVILAAMFDNLSVDDAQSVLSSRDESGFETIDDFWQQSEIKNLKEVKEDFKAHFSVTSNYFKLVSKTTYDDSRFIMTSLLAVDSGQPKQTFAQSSTQISSVSQGGQLKTIARRFGE